MGKIHKSGKNPNQDKIRDPEQTDFIFRNFHLALLPYHDDTGRRDSIHKEQY